jgi:hypothetical protein
VYAEPDLLVVETDLDVESDPVVETEPVMAPAPAVELVEHPLEIVESGAFARAVCGGCSWSGPARRSRAVAAADAEKHSER